MEKKIYIEGMKCSGCSSRIENSLKTLKKVRVIEVSLENKFAHIECKSDKEIDQVCEKIKGLGFEITKIEDENI